MLVHKVLQEVSVAFEVVELVHEGREADNREALKGVEEKCQKHFSAGFLLHVGLQQRLSPFDRKPNPSPDTS